MYAVIETGGKQHKVEKGMVLSVDLLKDDVGKKITLKMCFYMLMEIR